MADLIFEVQSLRDEKNKYIPKELAVTSVQGYTIGHWFIKSPHIFDNLPYNLKVMNNFCTSEVHGIEWWEGDITLDQLKRHIFELTKIAKLIYTRGSENVKFLESLLCRHVINLENYHAPFYTLLRERFNDEKIVCSVHSCQKKTENLLEFCALNKVQLLKRWICSLLPEKSKNTNLSSSRIYNALREYSIQNFEDGFDVVDGILTDAATVGTETPSSEDDDEFYEIPMDKKILKNEYSSDYAGDSDTTEKNKNYRSVRC